MITIPVYNKVIVPYADIYFRTEDFTKLAGKGHALNEKVVILMAREELSRTEYTEDSFYPIGVAGVISEINPQGFVKIKTMNRVNIDIVGIDPNHSISLTISRRQDIQDLDEAEAYQKLQGLRKEIIDLSEGYQWNEFI